MIDPATTVPLVPGTQSWAEQYGPIGVVAALAVAALVLWLKVYFSQQKEDRDRQNKAEDEANRRSNATNDKLVETITGHHRETLELVASMTREFEQRYQVLLDRHIGETRSNADALRANSTATAEALSGLVKKLSKTPE